ncbi:MAG: shikimate kinase [Acholeplasmatales bacterium]|nr:shikimate kinase [Acholeplasmatales bacterium]
MRIYLIGLPASGKSTVGKELAKKIKYNFIDLDSLIESRNNMSIPDMFNISEDYFRDKEAEALESIKVLENVVVSCGGGIVVRESNKALMDGKVVYLDCPLDEISFRLNRDSTIRPVSKKIDIYTLDRQRHDKYISFMDFKVDSRIISHTVKDIRKELKI